MKDRIKQDDKTAIQTWLNDLENEDAEPYHSFSYAMVITFMKALVAM